MFESFFAFFGTPLRSVIKGLGRFGVFTIAFISWLFRRPWRLQNIFERIEQIGVNSLPIIILVSAFSGMVFALQTGYSFQQVNLESAVGATVGLAMTRELAPVFSALMLTARAGSAMAAEIASMRVTEQIDALKSMAVSPIHYLVVPRVIACVIALPLLTGIFDIVGIAGSYLVGIYVLNIPEGPFLYRLETQLTIPDILQGIIKAFFFGLVLSLISCYKGYTSYGGAAGVGRSTREAVVYSSVSVLVLDFFLTYWIIQFFPQQGL
jgi:phospholipid/cholesterol/gamma-HCH transport system permease protein